jgi:hypothetical protein
LYFRFHLAHPVLSLHRKKLSLDLAGRAKQAASPTSDVASAGLPTSGVPSISVNGEDAMGSIPPSPTRQSLFHSPTDGALTISTGNRHFSTPPSIREEDWADNHSEHERLVHEFNRQRPLGGYQSRISSWSDPMSAREIFDGEDPKSKRKLKPSQLGNHAFSEEALSSAQASSAGSPTEQVDGFRLPLWEDGRSRCVNWI